ncbi:hypothetical protein CLOP_g5102 [Closterium sp. NIES-67]|nr:hypothetical protein CLOP_g5102 [Closterium sp. NIES-67]
MRGAAPFLAGFLSAALPLLALLALLSTLLQYLSPRPSELLLWREEAQMRREGKSAEVMHVMPCPPALAGAAVAVGGGAAAERRCGGGHAAGRAAENQR